MRCPTCGHPVSADRFEGLFQGRERRLYQIIAEAGQRGIDRGRVMELLYADDPAGGPTSANIVCVMINSMRKRLAPFGITITASGGPGSLYRIAEGLNANLSNVG